jgi:hypothetical protein
MSKNFRMLAVAENARERQSLASSLPGTFNLESSAVDTSDIAGMAAKSASAPYDFVLVYAQGIEQTAIEAVRGMNRKPKTQTLIIGASDAAELTAGAQGVNAVYAQQRSVSPNRLRAIVGTSIINLERNPV